MCILKFVHARLHDRRLRDTQSSQRRLVEGATTASQSAHRELAPTDPHQVYHLCSHLRIVASVDSKVAHNPSRSDPRAFQLQEFFKLREHQSPLLARQSTPADTRKGDVQACVLTPSVSAGKRVAALWVAHSPCRTCRPAACMSIGSFQN